MKPFFVYVTTADKDQARAIGRHLVQSRLAACVNILDNMNSMYYWQDEFQDDQEAVLIAKTTQDRLQDLIDAVREKHSYDCPCIVAIPITSGNPAFLEWIGAQV
jgi:periplasmic divalent cation tolerance protein